MVSKSCRREEIDATRLQGKAKQEVRRGQLQESEHFE